MLHLHIKPIHPYTHTPIHPYTHTHIYPYTHTPIHPYTHTHIYPYTHLGVLPNMVRVSVGLEAFEDITTDFQQALEASQL
jgi:O-acetylhomoserine/O-acetylserine sulfhydrylase-like pyridoxal-dependent enzyme